MGITTRDVKSLSKSGSTKLKGDVTLSAGSNVTLTQSGQNIEIAAAGGAGGTPGGGNTQVQFNDSSSFGGDAGLVYNKTTDTLTAGNLVLTNDLPVTEGGTGASTAADARTNLGAAASGANTDLTSVYLNNTGLKVKDTNASHGLTIAPGSDLTADRTLTITTGDAARTITLSGDTTLSGTNSGDQTITLTGDVTGSGTGSFAATIANDAVTYAKMQNVSATDKVLGRSTAGAGDVEEIACTAAGRALIDDADATAQRTTLGLGTIATQAANSVAITGGSITGITDLAVADGGTGASTAADARTNLSAAASGANTDITSIYLNNTGLKLKDTNGTHGLIIAPGSDLTVDRTLTVTTGDADRTLTVNASTTLGGGTHSGTNTGDQNLFSTIAVSGQSDVVADSTTDTLTLAAGSNVTITTNATTDTITIASSGAVTDGDKGDITVSASGATWTIDNDVVTYAKMQNVTATNRLLGRSTAGAGDVEEITVGGDITQSGSTFTIANDAVSYAKMQNVSATNRILGRITAGAGDTEELTGDNVRTITGLATTDSPQFTAINLGHATDTTIARTGAGDIAIEGNAVYRAGGTDVALADGGTGASLTDPNADRILFWDDSAGAVTWLTAGSGLTITDTTITASGGGGGGITWNEATGATTMAVDNGYIANHATVRVELTLPTTAAVGKVVRVSGKGAAGWKILQNASEIIHFGNADTTTGAGGYLESTHRRDAVELVCVVADTEWNVISSVGNITYV